MDKTLPRLTALLLLLMPPLASAQPTTRPATHPAQLGALLSDLGADAFADRQRAQLGLVDIGPPAVADLRRLAHNATDPEVRARAADALRRLADGLPWRQTRVTLHLDDAAPRAAFDALAAAEGVKFEYDPADPWAARPGWPAAARVSVHADDEPFWAVFHRLAQATDAEIQDYNDGRLVLFRTNGLADYPTVLSGPFAVELRDVRTRSDAGASYDRRAAPVGGGAGPVRTATLDFSIYTEPKLTLRHATLTLTEATDARGRSLLPARDAPGWEHARNARSLRWAAEAALDPEAVARADRIATLKGVCRLTVELPEAPQTLAPLRVGATSDGGGLTLSVTARRDEAGKDVYTLSVPAAPDEATAFRISDSVEFRDAEGHPLQAKNYSVAMGAQTLELTYWLTRPANVGRATSLSWTPPAPRRTLQVPFEFHDLPLP